MPLPVAPPSYATLSAMITPAIFLTANGSLIISTSNRMSRVVDRIRVLNDLGDRLCRGVTDLDYVDERSGHVQDQLDRLRLARRPHPDRPDDALPGLRRVRGDEPDARVRRLDRQPPRGPADDAGGPGRGLMLFACVNLVREAMEALRSNRLEIRFFRDLHARRRGGGGGCS